MQLTPAQSTITDSIVPKMQELLSLKNVMPHKYSCEQWKEVQEIVAHKNVAKAVRIVSYNVLFNLKDHEINPENRWEKRKYRVIASIKQMNPEILGLQELYSTQLTDVSEELSAYSYSGKSCEDGEYNPIFFKKGRYTLVNEKSWRMNFGADTKKPYFGSKQLNMVQVFDKSTGKTFCVFNTHLSYFDADERLFQAKFILKKLEKFAAKFPVVLASDMNLFPARTDLERLPFYDGDYINRLMTSSVMREVGYLSVLGHLGPISTFTNDGQGTVPFTGTGTPGVCLDRMYATALSISVVIEGVNPAKVDGHFPSDHMPIMCYLIIK